MQVDGKTLVDLPKMDIYLHQFAFTQADEQELYNSAQKLFSSRIKTLIAQQGLVFFYQ